MKFVTSKIMKRRSFGLECESEDELLERDHGFGYKQPQESKPGNKTSEMNFLVSQGM